MKTKKISAHPYRDLEDWRYWRAASAAWRVSDFTGMYQPKWPITAQMKVASGGSCFAQHIARNLRRRGFNFCDFEPAPPTLPAALHQSYGYGYYSARYGNIYTSRQLLQLLEMALGLRSDSEIWEEDGRFFDALRPSIEPNGFGSREEAERLRAGHLAAVSRMVREADLFVFTLGLTETWFNSETGLVYPTCPGTVAGIYDPSLHGFTNLGVDDVVADMTQTFELWHKVNPGTKFLLTVSPVPLAATARQRHVVQSTMYSKAVLRVSAEKLADHDHVDYFPSYELVVSHLNKNGAYMENMRDVSPSAVENVMECFFLSHTAAGDCELDGNSTDDERMIQEMAVICDEESLDMGAAK